MSKLIGLLLFICLVSLGDAYLKIYPLFFALFVLLSLFSGVSPTIKDTMPVLIFTLIAVILSVMNSGFSFDIVSFVKLILNFTFLVFAVSYARSVGTDRMFYILRLAAVFFICITFLQVLYIIVVGNLWLMPFKVTDSSSSYFFSKYTIYYGDLNKNIWASKVCVFFMIFCTSSYFLKKFNWLSFLVFFFSMFTFFYVSSRTAQLAAMLFVVTFVFYHYWFVIGKKYYLLPVMFIFLTVSFFVVPYVLRFDLDSLAGVSVGHHYGDGFISRLIIWRYIFLNPIFDNVLLGHGLMSFDKYTLGVFSENNPHNVYLNIFMDFGIFALISYIMIMYRYIRGASVFIILPAFLVISNSQFLGYDTDIIVLLLISSVISMLKKPKHLLSNTN